MWFWLKELLDVEKGNWCFEIECKERENTDGCYGNAKKQTEKGKKEIHTFARMKIYIHNNNNNNNNNINKKAHIHTKRADQISEPNRRMK